MNWKKPLNFFRQGAWRYRYIITNSVFCENRFGNIQENLFPIGKTFTLMNVSNVACVSSVEAFLSGQPNFTAITFILCPQAMGPRDDENSGFAHRFATRRNFY